MRLFCRILFLYKIIVSNVNFLFIFLLNFEIWKIKETVQSVKKVKMKILPLIEIVLTLQPTRYKL